MTRNYSQYPDDENGNALWQMVEQGDPLTVEREVEFSVNFATEEEAMKFGEFLLLNRQKVLLCDGERDGQPEYSIMVSVSIVPSYEAITDYQQLLDEHAKELNGLNGGWGCRLINA